MEEYLERELDATYANRVIPGVGLAISVWSIDSVTEALILAGDGGMLPTGACAHWWGGLERASGRVENCAVLRTPPLACGVCLQCLPPLCAALVCNDCAMLPRDAERAPMPQEGACSRIAKLLRLCHRQLSRERLFEAAPR